MEHDLSEGKFYAGWPDWLRWILFLPSGVVGCIIVSTLFNIFVALFADSGKTGSVNHGWYSLVSSGILGTAFVGISSYVAPKKQFEVAVIMIAVLSVIIAAIFIRSYDLGFYKQTKDLLYYSLNSIVALGGGLTTVFIIRGELDSHTPHVPAEHHDNDDGLSGWM